ncbi:MAG: Hsp20/alpha crystallin family protein [Acidimicrobiia bacterium]|nr:Hsp20/alpha crystallin family protein [Acidimicrobiia bacterium]
MIRRDPFRDLFEFQFPRGVSELLDAPGTPAGAWRPPLDLYETREAYVVIVDVPGVPAVKLDVTLEAGVLTVKGERKFHSNVPEDSFHRVERRFGTFTLSIALPSSKVDSETVTASVADGVLTVEVPKAAQALPRRIEVVADPAHEVSLTDSERK